MIVNNPNFRRRSYSNKLAALQGLGQSNINPTTIWTPQTGFLATPGVVTATDLNIGTSSYVAPTTVQRPACSYDPNPFVANSAQCIALLLAAQQANFKGNIGANYNVDLYDCLNTFPQPTDCYERTFGLTPIGATGGVNVLTSNPLALLTGAGVTTNIPTDKATQATQTQQQINAGSNPSGSGPSDIINTLETSSVNLLGYNIPYWAIGLVVFGGVAYAASK